MTSISRPAPLLHFKVNLSKNEGGSFVFKNLAKSSLDILLRYSLLIVLKRARNKFSSSSAGFFAALPLNCYFSLCIETGLLKSA